MSVTATTLASDLSATSQTARVTAATGATVGGICKIDQEVCFITSISGVAIGLRRTGDYGSYVIAHDILAPVTFGLTSDFPDLGPTEVVQTPLMTWNLRSVGENGVIPVPTRNTVYFINKGSALSTSTFANPSALQEGLEVCFVGGTDFAHVVTTVDVNDGTTGSHTTLTSPAFAGGALTLIAVGTHWYVKSNNLWVIT